MHLRCPHCQNPIELADLPSGGEVTCIGCGSTFQLDNFSTVTWAGPTNKRLGKFEVLETVGHGAFGTVVKAHDSELDRIVAIKIPRASNVGSGPEDVARFLREARAVAQLRFPSIITIHEVGSDNGMPYLVCDFVEGITLADHLTGRGFSFTQSARLLAEVADALQYAHSLGVVHRDVKPSNIMIRPDGSPCVMDFGLAKRDAGEITMTIDGQILGTPAYMSPEQARGEGHRVDGRSDVYSLGVILYQLLTNELPFRGNKAMLLHQVLHEEPRGPRTFNDKIPRDLETIALKAMAKEPGRRYGSAKEMAEDLRRWLVGEPILARPVGTIERLWCWGKRNPALATANAAVVLALATFTVAFFIVSASLEQEQIERGKAQELAREKENLAAKADEQRENAEELALRIQLEHYLSKADSWPDTALVGMASLLPKATHLKDQSLANLLRLLIAAWSGRAAAGKPIGPPLQHQEEVRAVALSADGKMALTGSAHKTARLWATATGKPIGPPLQHQDLVVAVALSADGNTALTGSHDKTARLWETSTGKPIGPPLQHQHLVLAVALNAGGKTALTGCDDKTARLWDTATGKPIGPPLQHQDRVYAVALSADGKIALTGSGNANLWDTSTGKPMGPPLQHQVDVVAVALSADGTIALTTSEDTTARLWDTSTGKPIGPPLQHQGLVLAVALSADGKTALTGSHDMTARLWDTATGKPIGPPLQHQASVYTVALSADGKTVLTGGFDKAARLWGTSSGEPSGPLLPHESSVNAVALSADGTIALTGSDDTTARLWDTSTGKPIGLSLQHKAGVLAVALSANRKTALTGSIDKTARLWDTATGKPIGPPLQHQAAVEAVALSADGKTAVTRSSSIEKTLNGLTTRLMTARLWDTAIGKPIGPPLQHESQGRAVTLSEDGKKVLTAGFAARLWDTATGKPIEPPLQHQEEVRAVAFSADGKIALTGSEDTTARLWETSTGKQIGPPLQHQQTVTAVALSADGKNAITGSSDKTARLWDTATGKPIGPPLQHLGDVLAVALSANGKVALTGSFDKTARLWETATGKPIGPPLQHSGYVSAVALSADGNTALTGSFDNTARLWKVPHPIRGDPERILVWAQLITGLEVDELTPGIRNPDDPDWSDRRARLQKLRRARLEKLGGSPVE